MGRVVDINAGRGAGRFVLGTLAASAGVFTAVLLWPAGAPWSASAATAGRAALPEPRGPRFDCRVTGVHDGDGPIYCASGEKVRLTAIAARETDGRCAPGHPCPAASAAAATDALRRLAMGQTLVCEKTGTSYGRVTAWCWRDDGVELNCAMVEGGTAAYWRRYDPDRRLCG
jgi:endonuclease YncB( thermonuclease family)